MSLHLEFEPHSWYMGFAIQDRREFDNDPCFQWEAVTDDGMTYAIHSRAAETLKDLRRKIRAYHLNRHTGYGERLARRRLEALRTELEAERMSYGELAELASLASYIADDDMQLLEAAGVPENA